MKTRSRRPEVRGRRTEVGSQKAGDQKAEGSGQKVEARGKEAEGSEQKAEASRQWGGLQSWVENTYARAVAEHGDLEVTFEYFAARIDAIISKRHRGSRDPDALVKFVDKLHPEDLYLATSCGQNTCNEAGWERFVALYSNHIGNVARAVCSTHQQARDVESEIIPHLFFPDSQGRSRIATYDALSALKTWLVPIIKHRGTYHRQLKWNEAVSLETLQKTPSATAADELEAALLNARYGNALIDSFKAAANRLTARERLVFLLLHEDQIPRGEVAKMIGLHQSQITRTENKAEQKFSATMMDHLRTGRRLAPDALRECIAAIFRDPQTVTIALLETIRTPTSETVLASAAA